MIKQLLFSSALAISSIGISQTNLGFETWSGGNPTGWTTYNVLVSGSVTQITTGAPEGSSAAKMQTKLCSSCPFFGLPSKAPGSLLQKAAYTASPTSVDLYLMHNIAAGDTGGIAIQTFTGSTTSLSNIVSQAALRVYGTPVTSWTPISLPFITVGAGAIDSIVFEFTCSDSMFVQGSGSHPNTASTMSIDGIVLNLPLGVKEAIGFNEFFAYPNPAANEFNIVTKNEKAVKASIYDVTGRLMTSIEFVNKKINVNTLEFNSGIYIYRIVDENNVDLKSGKFHIAR